MIGVLDSGVGGLSVLREIRTLLPEQDLCYVGDSAFCPYGAKSPEVLRERVGGVVEYLLAEGAEVVVLACNSATIQAVEWCRTKWPEISFVGMEPGVKPAVAQTRSGVIGVFATEASLTGEMFARLVARCGSGCEVLTRACPRFVELVEEGVFSGEKVEAAVREYGDELVTAGADVLVLGCTHYHFLEEAIQKVYPQVALINTGLAVARRVRQVCEEMGLDAASERGETRFVTSGSVTQMETLRMCLIPEVAGPVTPLPALSFRAEVVSK